MRPLVWFRSDLRIGDHPALFEACRSARRGVVAVFVVCPRQWREAHDWGDAKVDFLRRNLEALSAALEGLRIPLLIETVPDFVGAPAALLSIARRHECDALFFNRELEVYERRRDAEVEKLFRSEGLAVRSFHDQTVLEPSAVQKGQGGFYSVFTPFHRNWKRQLLERGFPEPLGRPKRQLELVCRPSPVPAQIEGFRAGASDPELWPAGAKAVRRSLDAFLADAAPRYPDRRDLPDVEGTSRLSAALALGVISAREVLATAIAANQGELEGGSGGVGNPGLAAWMRQVAWREFYRHVLVGFPRVSKGRAFQVETERIAWRDDDAGFAAWCEGRTGFPIVDAGLRQLLKTGWMHNRLRMVTAMFLTKDLLLDWRLGERHFMRHLVDGDLANNNGGWQWAASTGTDAVPYFRVMNPWTQGKRFDPEGRFIRRFVPELASVPAAALHDPAKLVLERRRGLDYPAPILDHGPARERAIAAFRRLA